MTVMVSVTEWPVHPGMAFRRPAEAMSLPRGLVLGLGLVEAVKH
jgi:hypothetical protein